MAAPTLVFQFLGVVFSAILYGLYCLIFGLYWRIQLKRADRWNGVLLYALNAIFVLCTAFFIIAIIQTQLLIDFFTGVLELDSVDFVLNRLFIVANFLYTAIDFISQLILLYRCWIMWRQPSVMVIPCFLSLAFLVISLTTFSFGITFANKSFPDWYSSAVTATFFISLVVNVLVTALIVYKIINVYNDIRGFNNSGAQASSQGDGRRDLSPLISILVESGLITFVGQLAQTIMFKSAPLAFPLIGTCVVMLYGISSTVVLVRVEMGISYDTTNTSRTVNSSNSGRPMQLKPFTSKIDQTTIVEAESDDPRDSRSERKLTCPN